MWGAGALYAQDPVKRWVAVVGLAPWSAAADGQNLIPKAGAKRKLGLGLLGVALGWFLHDANIPCM